MSHLSGPKLCLMSINVMSLTGRAVRRRQVEQNVQQQSVVIAWAGCCTTTVRRQCMPAKDQKGWECWFFEITKFSIFRFFFFQISRAWGGCIDSVRACKRLYQLTLGAQIYSLFVCREEKYSYLNTWERCMKSVLQQKCTWKWNGKTVNHLQSLSVFACGRVYW